MDVNGTALSTGDVQLGVVRAPAQAAGLALLAAGPGWLALVRADGTFWADVLPASLVAA